MRLSHCGSPRLVSLSSTAVHCFTVFAFRSSSLIVSCAAPSRGTLSRSVALPLAVFPAAALPLFVLARMSASPARTGLSLFILNTKRVLAYLRHHGPLRGGRQLLSVVRQMHELRLGDFKGRDAQGNEFYEDPYALQKNRRRFVVYANSQQRRLHNTKRRYSRPLK